MDEDRDEQSRKVLDTKSTSNVCKFVGAWTVLFRMQALSILNRFPSRADSSIRTPGYMNTYGCCVPVHLVVEEPMSLSVPRSRSRQLAARVASFSKPKYDSYSLSLSPAAA